MTEPTKRSYHTATSLSPAESDRANSLLHSLLSKYPRHKYRKAADELGFSYSFVHQVAAGKLPPSRPMLKKLCKISQEKIYGPTRPRLSTEFVTDADKDLVRDELPNDERARLLVQAAKEINGNQNSAR